MKLAGSIALNGNGNGIEVEKATEVHRADLILFFTDAKEFRLEHEQHDGRGGKPEDSVYGNYAIRLRDGNDVSMELYLDFNQARAVKDVLVEYVAAREALLRLRAK
ncbi:MAG: hypothetical protein ABFD52_06855 [Acidobacteriota bacterium]